MDGFAMIDMNKRIVEFNKSFMNMLGYNATELSRLTLNDVTPEKWRDVKKEIIEKEIIPIGFSQTYEMEYIKKDGTLIPVEIRAFLIKDFQGKNKGIGTVIRDISHPKQSQIIIENALKEWDVIFNSKNDAIIILDRNGIITHANRSMGELLHKSNEEFLGGYCYQLIHCSKSFIEDCPFQKMLNSGKREVLELNTNGKYLLIYADPIFDENGKIKGAVHIVRDITEQKRKDEEIIKINAKLEKLNHTKNKFFSLISHDLKSPFNGLLIALEMLTEEYDFIDDSEKKQLINQMQSMTKQTYELIEDLFKWAQTQTGEINYSSEKFPLSDIVESEKMKLSAKLDQKCIKVINHIDPEIEVIADEKWLGLLIYNLIGNAVKFSYRESKIDISAVVKDNFVEFSIQDYGVGISESNLSKIFQIDKHLITAGTLMEKGTGLGLVICKEIVTLHHGNIWVQSQEGKGSTFTFSIPLNIPA